MSVNLFNKPYWIVGFTDAEGCFRINTYSGKVSFDGQTFGLALFILVKKILTLEFYMILNPFLIVDKLLLIVDSIKFLNFKLLLLKVVKLLLIFFLNILFVLVAPLAPASAKYLNWHSFGALGAGRVSGQKCYLFLV